MFPLSRKELHFLIQELEKFGQKLFLHMLHLTRKNLCSSYL